MARVTWLSKALSDVDRLYCFLHAHNPEAAETAVSIILRTADLLEQHPRIGRPMPDDTGRRELFAAHGAGAYVIRYELVDSNPVIIRVWHSRENRDGQA